ncbi:MAG: acylphosphatase [Magnetococcales bacterium]|nr:acylphosphatase [Magnetococcales bacterium]
MSANCLRLRIHGRVQGVWFRESTKSRALELGVSGWVRNLGDGTVEAEMHGEVAAVRALADWCRVGPPAARVERVEESPCPKGGTGQTGFVVLR